MSRQMHHLKVKVLRRELVWNRLHIDALGRTEQETAVPSRLGGKANFWKRDGRREKSSSRGAEKQVVIAGMVLVVMRVHHHSQRGGQIELMDHLRQAAASPRKSSVYQQLVIEQVADGVVVSTRE